MRQTLKVGMLSAAGAALMGLAQCAYAQSCASVLETHSKMRMIEENCHVQESPLLFGQAQGCASEIPPQEAQNYLQNGIEAFYRAIDRNGLVGFCNSVDRIRRKGRSP